MPLKMFLSYARKDQALKDELLAHLALMKRLKLVDVWHDRDISAGSDREDAINGQLDQADIVLLLVSSDFMNSEYSWSKEIKRSLERHDRLEAIVVPVIVRPVQWHIAPFGRLQALPEDARPITDWPNHDSGWLSVTKGLITLTESLIASRDPDPNSTSGHAVVEKMVPSRPPASPKAGDLVRDDASQNVFCYIPPGDFIMGRDSSPNMFFQLLTGDVDSGESPAHRVHITKSFWLARYPVTQAQWERVMGQNPSRFRSLDRPVEGISWNDAQNYVKRLNSAVTSIWSYRLPTEAEWEYAARGGSSGTHASVSAHDVGWFDREDTQPVGRKRPNAWGLHDMLGNVWEWCNDWSDLGMTGGYYSQSPSVDPPGPISVQCKTLRGAAFYKKSQHARFTIRNFSLPNGTELGFGVRVVATPRPT